MSVDKRQKGVHLDRTLNFKQPMKTLPPRLHILGVINDCLTVTTWGGCAITLRISTQALVFSAAWIRVTVWRRTPHVKVGVNINSVTWTISGCLTPTYVFQLLVLRGIALMVLLKPSCDAMMDTGNIKRAVVRGFTSNEKAAFASALSHISWEHMYAMATSEEHSISSSVQLNN